MCREFKDLSPAGQVTHAAKLRREFKDLSPAGQVTHDPKLRRAAMSLNASVGKDLSSTSQVAHAAKLRRAAVSLNASVGKEVQLNLPPRQQAIVKADKATLVSTNGARAIVRVGKAHHTVDVRYVKP